MHEGEKRGTVASIVARIADVDQDAWNACANPDPATFNPFVAHAFLRALEESGSVGARHTGWLPQHIVVGDEGGGIAACAPCYVKLHSAGEYVFDHSWAAAYEQAGGHYYPKLQVAVPFTPVPGPRLLVRSDVDQSFYRQVLGAECLLRWSHPDMGEVSPGSFIPVAEETGLIVPIGEWVFGEVCRQLREWNGSAVRVSVNVSARQFRQPELVDFIGRSLQEARLQPDALAVEITESALIDDPENAAATLSKLKDMGLTISLDDFGTGYSSLSYLRRFPVDKVKIDRSFIAELPSDRDQGAIVSAIVALAHALQIRVVGEGVENERQREFLKSCGCDFIQGHLVGHPADADSAAEDYV